MLCSRCSPLWLLLSLFANLALSFLALCFACLCLAIAIFIRNCYLYWAFAMIGKQNKHKKQNTHKKHNKLKRLFALFPSTLLPLVCLVLVVCLFGCLFGFFVRFFVLFVCLFCFSTLSFVLLCSVLVEFVWRFACCFSLSNCYLYLALAICLLSISYDRKTKTNQTNKQTNKQTNQTHKTSKTNKQTNNKTVFCFVPVVLHFDLLLSLFASFALSFSALCFLCLCLAIAIFICNCYLYWAFAMIGTQTKHKQTKQTKTNKQNKQNQQTTKRRCALFPSTLLPLVCLVLVCVVWLVGWFGFFVRFFVLFVCLVCFSTLSFVFLCSVLVECSALLVAIFIEQLLSLLGSCFIEYFLW